MRLALPLLVCMMRDSILVSKGPMAVYRLLNWFTSLALSLSIFSKNSFTPVKDDTILSMKSRKWGKVGLCAVCRPTFPLCLLSSTSKRLLWMHTPSRKQKKRTHYFTLNKPTKHTNVVKCKDLYQLNKTKLLASLPHFTSLFLNKERTGSRDQVLPVFSTTKCIIGFQQGAAIPDIV